jgi:hypothetical protein
MRKETMSIKEFMNRGKNVISPEEKEIMKKGKTAGYAFGLSMLPLAFAPIAKPVSAQTVTVAAQGQMYDKMIVAFNPLIDLIQALAYPIAMVVVLGGAIMVMINQKEKGYSLMMGAGLGYVLVNMTPMVLNILVDAMKSVV